MPSILITEYGCCCRLGGQNCALYTLLKGKVGEASNHIQYSVSSSEEGFAGILQSPS